GGPRWPRVCRGRWRSWGAWSSSTLPAGGAGHRIRQLGPRQGRRTGEGQSRTTIFAGRTSVGAGAVRTLRPGPAGDRRARCASRTPRGRPSGPVVRDRVGPLGTVDEGRDRGLQPATGTVGSVGGADTARRRDDHEQETMIQKLPKKPTAMGPADSFTGDVYLDGIRGAMDGSRLNMAHVHFAPGARTHWHSHPVGQTLFCTDGSGLVV